VPDRLQLPLLLPPTKGLVRNPQELRGLLDGKVGRIEKTLFKRLHNSSTLYNPIQGVNVPPCAPLRDLLQSERQGSTRAAMPRRPRWVDLGVEIFATRPDPDGARASLQRRRSKSLERKWRWPGPHLARRTPGPVGAVEPPVCGAVIDLEHRPLMALHMT
jgi:hypothetical protein